MQHLKCLCVYCGSRPGAHPAYLEAAETLGKSMSENGVNLVFGGGADGMMGALSHALVEGGGKATAIVPRFLRDFAVGSDAVDELIVTQTMHERKQLMFDRADAFAALPGGIGTLEEVIEMITWRQLGQHGKPVVLINVAGYWDPLVALTEHLISQDFSGNSLRTYFMSVARPENVLGAIEERLAAEAE